MNRNGCKECGGKVVIYKNELVCGSCGLVHRPVFDVDIIKKHGNPITRKRIFPKHNIVDNLILKIVSDGKNTRKDIVEKVMSTTTASKTQVYRRITALEAKGIISNIGYVLTIEKGENKNESKKDK